MRVQVYVSVSVIFHCRWRVGSVAATRLMREEAVHKLAMPRPRPVLTPRPRLHVAYTSFDLRNHATGWMIAGMFEAHNRSRVVVSGAVGGWSEDSAHAYETSASVSAYGTLTRTVTTRAITHAAVAHCFMAAPTSLHMRSNCVNHVS